MSAKLCCLQPWKFLRCYLTVTQLQISRTIPENACWGGISILRRSIVWSSVVLGDDGGCGPALLPCSVKSPTAYRRMLAITHFSSGLLGMFASCSQSNPPPALPSRRICLLHQIATSTCVSKVFWRMFLAP